MSEESSRDGIVRDFLEAARKKWSTKDVEAMRPILEATAEAIWNLENVQVDLEEPECTTATLEEYQRKENEKRTE
ncbi:MAG: hypothetical protein V1857_05275 [archaeon]